MESDATIKEGRRKPKARFSKMDLQRGQSVGQSLGGISKVFGPEKVLLLLCFNKI